MGNIWWLYRAVASILPLLQWGWFPAAECQWPEPAVCTGWSGRWAGQGFSNSHGLKLSPQLRLSSSALHWVLLAQTQRSIQTICLQLLSCEYICCFNLFYITASRISLHKIRHLRTSHWALGHFPQFSDLKSRKQLIDYSRSSE